MILYMQMKATPNLVGEVASAADRTRVYEDVAKVEMDEGFIVITGEDGWTIAVNTGRIEEWSMPAPKKSDGLPTAAQILDS